MIRAEGIPQLYAKRFAELETQCGDDGSCWLGPLRQRAMQSFESQGFPTRRLEEWRYFDLGPLRKTDLHHVHDRERVNLRRETLAGYHVHCLPGALLVFVDGYFEPVLSATRSLPAGVEVRDLATAIRMQPDLLGEHLGRYADVEHNAFVALNTAMLYDGAFVYVPRGIVVESPIHLMFVSTGTRGPTVSHPRTIVVAEEGAELTLIEDYVSTTDDVYFTNPVIEIALAPNARLDHYKLERESKKAFHVAGMAVQQDRDSCFASTSVSFGGHLVRNDVSCVLDGEGAECTLNGLNVIGDHQLVDDHTRIVHAKPHGTSEELYRSILDGFAEGVFNGAIEVAKNAQKTSSQQTNRNLVLSRHALMNTKPQLEIYADDVKCSHGATVGELDEDALFYLRARGIDADTARRILTYAFANDVLGRIALEPLRKTVESELFAFIPVGLDTKQPC
jgi:Fe-S cluster assembly protein SufD